MELGGCAPGKKYWLSRPPLYFFILAGLICLSSCIAVCGTELGGRNEYGCSRRGTRELGEANMGGLTLRLRHRDFTTAAPSSSSSSSPAANSQLGDAVKRSWRRLEYFERAAAAAAAGGGGASYKLSVYAAEGAAFLAAGAAIGTPAVGFTALVDTGSDLVWRPCEPCTGYCAAPVFDPASSSTFHVANCSDRLCEALLPSQTSCPSTPNCSYKYAYGNGSSFTSGDLAYDTLTLPDSSSEQPVPVLDIAFGCGHDNEFTFLAGAGGFLGLGQGPLSLPSQLGLNEFSYCLQTITDPTSSTSPLFLGPSGDLGTSFILSTRIITNPRIATFYYLGLEDISVGAQLLSLPRGTFDLDSNGAGGLIIDSGTTLSYFVESAYHPLLQAFNNSISLPRANGSATPLDLCYEKSGNVPSLTFHFDGGDLTVPAENYFITIEGLFCLAMAPSGGLSIFGNLLQQNFFVSYNQGAKTLSFAPKTCDSL